MASSSSTSSSPPRPDLDEYLFQSHYQPDPPQTQLILIRRFPLPTPPPTQFLRAPLLQSTSHTSPPSPSLTSLLRPSRPTTPDSSADELEPPVPRASPKVPTYEYYGFVLYLFSSLTFLLYLLWSYLPSPFLHALGIYYYPNRWWSLALPSWIVMLLVYIYVALASYNTGYLTLGMSSVETIIDGAANVCSVDGRGMAGASNASPSHKSQEEHARERRRGKERDRERERGVGYTGGGKERERERGVYAGGGREKDVKAWKRVWSRGTDAVMDVPLGGVCEILYGEGREDREIDDDDDY